tara:strand:+ start:1760 stop:1933 length:174 start_codon:yes stop_codon:yes gene_type:complete
MKKIFKLVGGAVAGGLVGGGGTAQIEGATDLQTAAVTFVTALVGLFFAWMNEKKKEA